MHGVPDAPAAEELLLHALEDEDVGVDGHAYRYDEAGDASGGQGDRDELEEGQHDGGVYGQGDGRHQAGQPVPKDEEETDQDEGDNARLDAALHGFCSQGRTDRLGGDKGDGNGQGTEVDVAHQGLSRLDGEAARDLGLAVGDLFPDDRGLDEDAVKEDADVVAGVIFGEGIEKDAAIVVHGETHDRLVSGRIELQAGLAHHGACKARRLEESQIGGILGLGSGRGCRFLRAREGLQVIGRGHAKFQVRSGADGLHSLVDVGDARKLDDELVGGFFRGKGGGLFGLDQRLGDAEDVDAPFDVVFQGRHGSGDVGRGELRDVGLIDEVGAAGEVQAQLERESGARGVGGVNKIADQSGDDDDIEGLGPVLKHIGLL